jgi:hypothetical protein
MLAGLGVMWIVAPDILATRRWYGLGVLLAMGAAVVLANLVFAAALAPGGPVQTLEWVPARLSDIRAGAQPLWTSTGMLALGFDVLPFVLLGAGLFGVVWADRTRANVAVACFAWTVAVVAVVLATKVRINKLEGAEAQRFFVAPFFPLLVMALVWLRRAARGSMTSVLLVSGIALPVFYTVFWLRERAPEMLVGSEANHPLLDRDLYQIDCRRLAAARLGETPEVTYVDETTWYFYTSCRSVYAPGFTDPPWTIKIRPAFETPQHLEALHRMVAADATVPAVCRVDLPEKNDRVCRLVRSKPDCRPDGEVFVRCPLSGADRAALLGIAPRT